MSINSPKDLKSISPLQRVQPIGDKERESRQGKRQAHYLGRNWSEEEEELPVDMPSYKKEQVGSGFYADRFLLERARAYLEQFATLEDKLSQLCFWMIEADYDREKQKWMEEQIQLGRVGGLIFTKGDFRRQTYLIERYQELAQLPLLMGNDFLQGLYFYFQGTFAPEELLDMEEARLCDLAKAIVSQNRKLGVQLQLVRKNIRGNEISLQAEQMRAFKRGLREAHGIVCRERKKELAAPEAHYLPQSEAGIALTHEALTHGEPLWEAFSLRSLYFLDLTSTDSSEVESVLKEAFSTHFDILMLSAATPKVPATLARLFAEGIISKAILDRQLLKVILLKMGAFGDRFKMR